MKLASQPLPLAIDSSDLLDPLEIIDAMLDLRAQLAELQQQVDALQPAFYAACATFASHALRTLMPFLSKGERSPVF